MQKTAIVIPCHNEADRLRPSDFQAAASGLASLHLLFVDDGSRDDTANMLESLRRSNPSQMHVVTLGRNCGKAEAARQGFLCAFRENYELVGFWDADLATSPEAIPEFCRFFETSAILGVIRARVRMLGRRIERRPIRHYAGRFFATAVSLLPDLPVYDIQCGAKLFRNVPAIQRVFRVPFTVDWTFDVEILARLLLFESRSECPPVTEAIVEYPLRVDGCRRVKAERYRRLRRPVRGLPNRMAAPRAFVRAESHSSIHDGRRMTCGRGSAR